MSDEHGAESVEAIEQEIRSANGERGAMAQALLNLTEMIKGFAKGDPDEDESASDAEDDEDEEYDDDEDEPMDKGAPVEVVFHDSFYDAVRATVADAIEGSGVVALSKGLPPFFEAAGRDYKALEASNTALADRVARLEETIAGMAKGLGAQVSTRPTPERTATDDLAASVAGQNTAARVSGETEMNKGGANIAPLSEREANAALNKGILNTGDWTRWHSDGLSPSETLFVRTRMKTSNENAPA